MSRRKGPRDRAHGPEGPPVPEFVLLLLVLALLVLGLCLLTAVWVAALRDW